MTATVADVLTPSQTARAAALMVAGQALGGGASSASVLKVAEFILGDDPEPESPTEDGEEDVTVEIVGASVEFLESAPALTIVRDSVDDLWVKTSSGRWRLLNHQAVDDLPGLGIQSESIHRDWSPLIEL